MKPRTALVTGATGYIGGRLVPELLAAGFEVRVLARDANRLVDRPWFGDVTVVSGDASDRAALDEAMAGVDVGYYLLHSLDHGAGFEEAEQAMARGFGAAAAAAGMSRIVYLGGLAPSGEDLSPHLASRLRVGQELRASGVPTAELRAAMIIGSGS
ncbi:MAG: SDR family NAD(P)-dependent oxidoreductase, partial [Actinomycetota bacterium]|nr:SDR family NAD(P)-dependent oxidoreductase [Actinomycetota bacterium]